MMATITEAVHHLVSLRLCDQSTPIDECGRSTKECKEEKNLELQGEEEELKLLNGYQVCHRARSEKKILCFAESNVFSIQDNAFPVLADIFDIQRFDILKALITNTDSSSMIAIFIDIFRRKMHMEVCNSTSVKESLDSNNETYPDMPFWTPSVLELVESVLRPPRGGPPSCPDASDAVLSALNLYRFVLMTESTEKKLQGLMHGKENHGEREATFGQSFINGQNQFLGPKPRSMVKIEEDE
ncbi:hypothetical protein Ahy_A06g028660 [Arachis hypogaea]|uniref:Uncharacterized protein n=1 Tax=Arachis hypogaea TaxID=3818 RepID=A0A445CRK2_ARAHY|nr:hypothetical protein Ahy_A06g028660 [Arachis hypogaea]